MPTCTECIKIDNFERERDAAIANLAKAEARITEAGAVNNRLAADLSRTQTERDTLRQQLANTLAANNAVIEALLLAGFRDSDTTIADDIRALAAERDTLRARLAERPAPADPRDPPVETAAEATVRRLRNYLSQRTGFDYTSDRHADTDLVAVVSRGFHDEGQTVNNLQAQLERAERIAKEQFEHRLYRT